jgi:uncharacterized SAM-dependent methyltransferase
MAHSAAVPDPADAPAGPAEPASVMTAVEAALTETEFAWSLSLIGEGQARKLATLAADLRRPCSPTGDGKRIASGFSYLGAEEAIAWKRACQDPLYSVMQESIVSFGRRWSRVRSTLTDRAYHYVSLGPGDGQKDGIILQDLAGPDPGRCYVAVDMSAEMLRLGVHDLMPQLGLSRSRTLPVQLDFSAPDNVAELCRLLHRLLGEQPIVFSLLGNTLANFDDDAGLLRMLGGRLLRPQDRLVLELATTPVLDRELAQEAAEEYGRSRGFREFVTTALMHHTDLKIDMESVLFHGDVENDRALLVKMIYQNRTGSDLRMMLPDRTDVSFPQQDTVRLYVTRKYARSRLGDLLADAGLHALGSTQSDLSPSRTGVRFGIDLLVLTAAGYRPGADSTVAEDIWR